MDTLQVLEEIGLGSRLKRLSESLMKEIQGIYTRENVDFDPYLFPAFHSISNSGGITNAQLKESLLTSQPAVTQTINKLTKKGLVQLQDDSTDKRRKQIILSEKGELLLRKLKPLWSVMDETMKEFTTSDGGSLIAELGKLEDNLHSGRLIGAMNEKIAKYNEITVVEYDDRYAEDFYELNVEWLETFFYVEDYDREVLSNPRKYIIEPGGHIFFAIQHGMVLGTVALMPDEKGIFELTKMAVSPKHRGKRIGQRLMQHCIHFGKDNKLPKLILYSNRKLENAIHIYHKYGFREIPVEPDCPYERSNIKMELIF